MVMGESAGVRGAAADLHTSPFCPQSRPLIAGATAALLTYWHDRLEAMLTPSTDTE